GSNRSNSRPSRSSRNPGPASVTRQRTIGPSPAPAPATGATSTSTSPQDQAPGLGERQRVQVVDQPAEPPGLLQERREWRSSRGWIPSSCASTRLGSTASARG